MVWLILLVVAVLQLESSLAWLPEPLAKESGFTALLDLNAIAQARGQYITRGCEYALQNLITDITADNLTYAETVMLQASGTGLNQAGQYKLCQRTPTVHHCVLRVEPYNYTLSTTPLAAVGLCLPDQCNPSDVQELALAFMTQHDITGFVPLATCGNNKKAWTAGAITVVVLLSVFGYLVLLATMFDVYRHYKNHRRHRKMMVNEHHLYQTPVAVNSSYPPSHRPDKRSRLPATIQTPSSSVTSSREVRFHPQVRVQEDPGSSSSSSDLPHLRPTSPHGIVTSEAPMSSLALFEDLSSQPVSQCTLETKRTEEEVVETTREEKTKTQTQTKTVSFSQSPEYAHRPTEPATETEREREREREPLVSLIEGKTALSTLPAPSRTDAWPSLSLSSSRHAIFGGTVPSSAWSPADHVRAELIPRTASDKHLHEKALHEVSTKADTGHHFWSNLISSFSLLRGWKKLMSPRSINYVAPLDGLRVLSMFWVILGHTYAFPLSWPGLDDGIASIAQDARTFTFQAVIGGFFAVDTFLFLSGFLVTLAILRRWNRKHQQHVDRLLRDTDEPSYRDLNLNIDLERSLSPGALPPSTFATASTRLACPEVEPRPEAQDQDTFGHRHRYRYRYHSLGAERQAEAEAEEADFARPDQAPGLGIEPGLGPERQSKTLSYMYRSKSSLSLGSLFRDLPFFYVNRYLRLTPLLLFTVLIFWHLYPKFGSGPFWVGNLRNGTNCNHYWWSTLLYINNFVPKHIEDMCLPWSWYLSVDTQLFILAPLLIMALFYSANLGLTLWLGASTISLTCLLALSIHYNLSQAITSPEWLTFFDKVYSKFYTRAHPYLMGMLTAYIFLRLGKAYRFSRTAIAMMVTVLAITLAAPVFGTYTQYKDDALSPSWSRTENVMYISFSRWSWGVGLALLTILACTHQAGIVGSFLGAKIWHPLARLTYATYLLHPILMIAFFESRTVFVEYSKTSMTLWCLAFIAASYVLALIAHLTIELPCSNLVDTLWNTLRHKPITATSNLKPSIDNHNNPAAGMALVA